MKYKLASMIHIVFLLVFLVPTSGREAPKQRGRRYLHQNKQTTPKLILRGRPPTTRDDDLIVGNQKEVTSGDGTWEDQSFGGLILRCVTERQQNVTSDIGRGKVIIIDCFKAAVIVKLLKYLSASPKTSIKFFNGFLELVKVPEDPSLCNAVDGGVENCGDGDDDNGSRWPMTEDQEASTEASERYFYKKVVEEVVDGDSERSERNKAANGNDGENVWGEVSRYLLSEKPQEKQLSRELSDPKLLSVLNEFSKKYQLKLTVYPETWVVMKRSANGRGVTFDLEYEELADENETGNDEDDGDEDINLSDDQDEDEPSREVGRSEKRFSPTGNRQARKGGKKKKKVVKKLSKHLKHLLIPFAIQLAVLPFFLKNLFFVAAKALLAGKAALILVVFNLLRNARIESENDRIRIEHYGYSKGEEYGAWINGRMLRDLPQVDSNEVPFMGQNPSAEQTKTN